MTTAPGSATRVTKKYTLNVAFLNLLSNMVKLTASVLAKKSRTWNTRSKITPAYIKKITHAHLQEQYIEEIGDLSSCSNLQVLYLQNNLLTNVDNLETAKNLTHVYLQRNRLSTISNLYNLYSLRKLYLGYNQISVVEGLEECLALEELHLERQNLPSGVELTFDPRVIAALSQRLRVLNVAGCNLTSLSELNGLLVLEALNASENDIKDLPELCSTLKMKRNLRFLDLRDNEVTRKPKYRDKVIASANILCTLDGRDITDLTRSFVQQFERKRSLIEEAASRPTQDILTASVEEFGKDLPAGVRQSVASKFMQESKSIPSLKTLSIPDANLTANNLPNHFQAFKSSTNLQSSRRGAPPSLRRHLTPRKARTAADLHQEEPDGFFLGHSSSAPVTSIIERINQPKLSPEVSGDQDQPDQALLQQLELSLRLVSNVLSLSETGMGLRGGQIVSEPNLI